MSNQPDKNEIQDVIVNLASQITTDTLLSKVDPKIISKLTDNQKDEFLKLLNNPNTIQPLLSKINPNDLPLDNPVFKKIFEKGMEWTKENSLSPENVMQLTTLLMKEVEVNASIQKESIVINKDVVEKKKFIVGPIKKNIVICVVKLIIEQGTFLTSDQKKILTTYVDKFLSQVIDVIVSVSNGEMNINDIGQVVTSCIPICFGKK